MCGIAGIFTVERPVDAGLVAAVLRMLDAQVHRGPNDWGVLIPEEAARDREIRALLEARGWEHVTTYPGSVQAPAAVLGNRRLSILDLSPEARMPMGTPDGRVWVTYNGEIYNFRELRSELAARGHTFRSQGDTETLLCGYVEWGPEVVHRLRGMFALGVLDARPPDGPRLFLAKDRFGIKPLYWARKNCVFQFASEVRALMAGGLIPNEPEPRGFHGFLLYGSVPTPWTTVRDVLSLPAAHRLAIDEVSYSYPKPQRYWALPEADSLQISREDAIAETRRLLDESVRMHLVSDVPVGVFLSGGMDSSAIVGFAARHLSSPLTTLCVTFDEAEFSEGEYAAAVARRHRTKHVEVRVRARDFVEEIPRILSAMDQPTVDGVNTHFVAKAAREAGLTVVLSGVGGDELFWGYPGFQRAPGLARLAALPGVPWAAAALASVAGALGVPRLEKLRFLREHPVLGAYLTVRGLFAPNRAARLLDAGRLPLWVAEPEGAPLTASRYARLEIAHYLQNQILRDTDLFGMTHSLEIRVPFLDHELAEFILALPSEYLAQRGRHKPLLAAAMADGREQEIAERPKMGFTFPLDRWLRDRWPEIARQAGHQEPIAPVEGEAVTADFLANRVHWSRPWALAVLRGMHALGMVPPWKNAGGPNRMLFLLPQLYGTPGGIQRYDQALVRASGEAFAKAGIAAVSVNDDGLPMDSVLCGRVAFTGAGPRTRPFHKARLVATTLNTAFRVRPHLVVCGHINLAPLALGIQFLTGARSILITYGIEAWHPSRYLRWAARRFDRVVSISRFTAERVGEWGIDAERLFLLPNPVDGEVFRLVRTRLPRNGAMILTVARLSSTERYKGVERFLRAFQEIRQLRPDVSYLVVGQGDDVPRLQRLAQELGVANAVEFRERVPDGQLIRIYNEADVFVMPSTKEGFGFVFLEAATCGTPVVGGDRDGSVDALLGGRLGQLIDPEETRALVRAIIAALDSSGTEGRSGRGILRATALEAYGFEAFRERVREVLVPKCIGSDQDGG
jgi:asparagine synthase (glutamine-hydrolysing)